MKKFIIKDNKWIGGKPNHGEKVQYISPRGGVCETYFNEPSKEDIELEWRDSELQRTLKLLAAPDDPQREEYLTYRASLYSYDTQPNFPDGERPTLESTT